FQANIPPVKLAKLSKPCCSNNKTACALRLPLRQCIITGLSFDTLSASITIPPNGIFRPSRLETSYSNGSRTSISWKSSLRSIIPWSSSTVTSFIALILFFLSNLRKFSFMFNKIASLVETEKEVKVIGWDAASYRHRGYIRNTGYQPLQSPASPFSDKNGRHCYLYLQSVPLRTSLASSPDLRQNRLAFSRNPPPDFRPKDRAFQCAK